MKSPIKNNTWIFAFLLTLVALTYGVFEIWVEHNSTTDDEHIELISKTINSTHQKFNAFHNEFIKQSNHFRSSVKQQLNESSSLNNIVKDTETEYEFWGMSVFKEKELFIWSDYGPQIFPSDIHFQLEDTSSFVNIQQNNNVTFLSYHAPVFINNKDTLIRYDVFTRKKIKQENILPIATDSELNPSALFQDKSDYPVHFSFFENPPANPLVTTTISTQDVDSVGIIYALSEDHSEYQAAKKNQFFLYRAIFYVVLILLVTLFLISVSKELTIWNSLLLKLFAISLAWLFFSNLEYGVGWIEIFYALGLQDFISFKSLIKYCIHSIFILLIVLVSFRPLLKTEIFLKDQSKFILPFILIVFGLLSSFLLYFFIIETYTLIIESPISVLSLLVFPRWDTLIFYISSGIFAISAITLLTMFGWFVIKINNQFSLFTTLLIGFGYTLGLFLLILIQILPANAVWALLIAGLLFITILIFVFLIHRNPTLLVNASRLRLLLLLSYVSVCIAYIAAYKGYSERLNSRMEQAVQIFVDEEETQAERIALNLLTNLEQNLSGLSIQDLLERPAYVENLFIQNTQQIISEDWKSFSISTQLVDNSGKIVAEYSSNLDTPAWTKAFNMMSLVIPFEEEQIRIENLRPIVRERPLREAHSNYSSFRRAWIPLYSAENKNRVAWILCSVYRERPQYEKPLRAVIGSQGTNQWDATINITEYVNSLSSRKNIIGIPLELPAYRRLPEGLSQQINQDSTHYRITDLANQQIRELFIATSDEQIIRAATSHPGFKNHLFSILRFFFSVLIAGLFVLGIFFWDPDFNINTTNRRFRDRLIDRFIFASLICLIALITTTYYGIKSQTQKSVQDQLLNKLENLTEVISQQETESEGHSSIPLNQISSSLDADASLYRNQLLDISTTGQIYTQHLLPRLLPWDVYESIFKAGNNQVTRRISLGNQELLIGYQPWLNEEGEIVGIASIPTFLEAPKFNEQMLSTTSYLLGFYAIIFGLFILGAALISTQLTSPLEALREGLKKISSGDLETILPVKSTDEIGSLTNAYNVMVYRLKELQKDLAKAEREAAWKEMAQQVAHEIKNPLTPMKLNLQHLERQLNASEEDFKDIKPQVEKIAKNMIGQIESLSQIASEFSKFAQPSTQKFEPVEVNDVLHSVTELYAQEKNLTINATFYKKEIWVSGVQDELRRVFINLVKNAHEAMPKGGLLKLHSTIDSEKEHAIISIKDNGDGIPKESQDQIFVPNFSTKSSGTGLGLAITKKIIEEHNGTISFKSIVGKGTTFTIVLPLKK